MKAWFQGEELKVEHLMSEFVSLAKRLAKHSDEQMKAAEEYRIEAQRALAREVAANEEAQKTDAILLKVKDLCGMTE
jgi:hypothetical protein